MPTIHTLDTCFLGESNVIANYLIESDDGLILVETGPETVHEHLQDAIAGAGYHWTDVRHVLLTHIHFDHAGGAWKFAEQGAKIYVHPIGLPHLRNPERLWKSAQRIYGDDMERLWGEMRPIDNAHLVALEDGEHIHLGGCEFHVHYTPGHAVHHNAYQLGEAIFTGDVAGVKIGDGPVVAPCPPPDIDLDAWVSSIQKLRDLDPKRLFLAHFGAVDSPQSHLDALETALQDAARWVKPYFEAGAAPEDITPKFVEHTRSVLQKAGVSDTDIDRNEKANPSYMSVTGLLRYWKLTSQGRL